MWEQAAVRARLARTPLYAYSQLEASRGVQKRSVHAASASAAKSGKFYLMPLISLTVLCWTAERVVEYDFVEDI